MEIEPLAGSRKALVTIENRDEVRILIDAMAPRAHFRYFKPFLTVIEGLELGTEFPKRVALTNGQLRWIGKRVAPWEKHPINPTNEEDIETAHGIAVSISEYLEEK